MSVSKDSTAPKAALIFDQHGLRRRMDKRKSFEKKVMLMSPGYELLDTATLIDISSGGAGLKLDSERWQHIPLNFVMLLTPDGSVKRLCEMVWRENRKIGVRFISPKKRRYEPDDPKSAGTRPSGPPVGRTNRDKQKLFIGGS